MDWQVIILTLGASLITGAVSLIGNIVASRSNIKKSQLENKSEYMHKRLQTYDQISRDLNYLEQNLSNKNALEDSGLETSWQENYHYCSKECNSLLYHLLIRFKNKTPIFVKTQVENIREQMKADLDAYYKVKDKIKQERLKK